MNENNDHLYGREAYKNAIEKGKSPFSAALDAAFQAFCPIAYNLSLEDKFNDFRVPVALSLETGLNFFMFGTAIASQIKGIPNVGLSHAIVIRLAINEYVNKYFQESKGVV